MQPRFLVTGGTGLIGKAAALALAARGHEVHVAGRRAEAAPGGDIRFHPGDFLAPGTIDDLLHRVAPTHVVHAAWDVTPGRYRDAAGNVDWLRASLDLVNCLRRRPGARLVGIGTCFEYDLGAGRLIEGETCCRPATAYGRCKLALSLAMEAARADGLSTAWGRVFYPYGPGEAPGRLLPFVARACFTGQTMSLVEGSQKRDFIFIDDLGEAIAAMAESDVEGAVNLCTGEAVTLRSIIDGLAGRLGGQHLMAFGTRAAANEDALPLIEGDMGRLTGEVGWRPRFDLERGLDRTADYWQANRQRLAGG